MWDYFLITKSKWKLNLQAKKAPEHKALAIKNIEGVFYVLIAGSLCATLYGIAEWLTVIYLRARRENVRYIQFGRFGDSDCHLVANNKIMNCRWRSSRSFRTNGISLFMAVVTQKRFDIVDVNPWIRACIPDVQSYRTDRERRTTVTDIVVRVRQIIWKL